MIAAGFGQPFQEQLDFFRQKLNLPTERWDDILKSAHDRAFVVAGAMEADLLADFRAAVDATIAEGKGLDWFRSQFDAIVEKHGWQYNGTRDWRSNVIYETNLRSSYAAGRYKQLTDPDLLKRMPYWRYVHSDEVMHPRPLHLAWDGLILRHDDPWWQEHYPPCGWGCKCRVFAVGEADLAKYGKQKPDTAPDNGTYEYFQPSTGEIHTLPAGVDFGWNYAPGNAALGRLLLDKAATAPAGLGAQAVANAFANTDVAQLVDDSFALWAERLTLPTGGRINLGALTPDLVEQVEAHGASLDTAVIGLGEQQARHLLRDSKLAKGNGIPREMFMDLPALLRNPQAVLWDKHGLTEGKRPALIYVVSAPGTGRALKIVVELGYVAKDLVAGGKKARITVNTITTAGLVDWKNIQDGAVLELLMGSV